MEVEPGKILATPGENWSWTSYGPDAVSWSWAAWKDREQPCVSTCADRLSACPRRTLVRPSGMRRSERQRVYRPWCLPFFKAKASRRRISSVNDVATFLLSLNTLAHWRIVCHCGTIPTGPKSASRPEGTSVGVDGNSAECSVLDAFVGVLISSMGILSCHRGFLCSPILLLLWWRGPRKLVGMCVCEDSGALFIIIFLIFFWSFSTLSTLAGFSPSTSCPMLVISVQRVLKGRVQFQPASR
jgi:hypothetical protein